MFASNYNSRVGFQPTGLCRSIFRPSTSPPPRPSPRSSSRTSSNVEVLHIRVAGTSAELRAAASLRAAAFSEQTNNRSDFAMQSYRRMKADSEWDVLESKLAGREPGYQDITVVCLIACLDDAVGNPRASAVREDMDLSCKIPAGMASSRPQLVVATLDINQGVNLPGEQLIGWEPEGALARTQRGYLSNICTHKAVRRTGVANRLIRAAMKEGSRAGIRWLYVHAAEQNKAAIQLYTQRCGFQLEQEEGAGIAIRLNRPRRLLFRQCLR